MRTVTVVLLSCILMGAMVSCASPPVSPQDAGIAGRGGEATGKTEKGMLNPALAYSSPGGTSEANAVMQEVQREILNTQAGENVIVSFAGSLPQALRQDAIIASISRRLLKEEAKEEPDAKLLDAMYDRLEARTERLAELCKAAAPDFSELDVVNLAITICKSNGAAQPEVGSAQVEKVAEKMAESLKSVMSKGGGEGG